MSFSYAPAFVIKKRKRIRQAVDPCLGFYTPASEIAVPHPAAVSNIRSDSTKGLECSVTSESAVISLAFRNPQSNYIKAQSDLIEKQVTVEDFLRCSTRTPIKTYRHRKRKSHKVLTIRTTLDPAHSSPADLDDGFHDASRRNRRRRAVTSFSSDSQQSAYVPSSEEQHTSSPKEPKFTRKKKIVKASMAYLRTAALLSHVELPNEPNDAHMSTLRPLEFVPLSPSLPCSPRSTKWRLVDPRRIRRYSEAHFFEEKPCPTTRDKEYKRLSSWKPPALDILDVSPILHRSRSSMPSQRRHNNEKTGNLDRPGNTPLTFIPLAKHECLLVEKLRSG